MAGASKQQEARSSTAAQCVECGVWSLELEAGAGTGTCIDVLCIV